MSDIMALYAEGASSLCVNGSVDMLSRLAGISASKYTGYPPYDDAPKEGEFDWEGFTRNLAIGLGVVAVCAIGAAISIATLGAGSILAGAFIGAGIGALSTTAMKAGEEISTGNVRSAKEAFRDVRISAASGFITGAFGAKFPGAHRLVEGVVDTAVSAGERLAYAVFDDSMSWDEKWAYALDPGQMVADFVTGVVIGEFLDGIMAATQNKLRSIFANNDAAMREALGSGSNTHVPSANTQVVRHPEIKSPNQVKMSDVTNYWDDYLGSNQTNIHPRTGLVDNDRIFSADGTKSIRFGNHEMDSMGTTKFHFHLEEWKYDPVNDVMEYFNTLVRIKR